MSMGIGEILTLAVTLVSGFSAVVIYITKKEITSENANFKDWVRSEFEKQEDLRRESARRQYDEFGKLEDRVRIIESAFKLDSQMFAQTLGFLREQFEEYKKALSSIKDQLDSIKLIVSKLQVKSEESK